MTLSIDPLDWLLAAAALALWLWLILAGRAQARRRAVGTVTGAGTGAGTGAAGPALLIAYASQGGRAEALARAEAAARRASGPVRVLPLEALDCEDLEAARQAIFIISTTGDGDPPDNAVSFLGKVMSGPAALGGLGYGLLALGDRSYPRFCGFARQFEAWLNAGGAKPLFAPIELDREDGAGLAAWHGALAETLPVSAPAPDAGPLPEPEGFQGWQLEARRVLNPGSPGPALCQLDLVPGAGVPPDSALWQAGDLAVVRVPVPGGFVLRDYSLASLPGDGFARLMVRRQTGADGAPGRGSDYLTRTLLPGAPLRLKLRANPGFHAPAPGLPLILIGAGSGLAGLMAHLRRREELAQSGGDPGPCWLLLGERSRQHDAHCEADLLRLQGSGVLGRLDRCFSRGPGAGPRYVQELVALAADELRGWLGRGAVVMVCGSRSGMAAGLREVLTDILGAPELAALEAAGRLRQDIY